MNLLKRIEELESVSGRSDDMLIIITAFVDCDETKMGPERAIKRKPIGYRAMGGDRSWMCDSGEEPEVVLARLTAEVQAEGRHVFAVCECY
jgi:hypothetical protein